MTRPRWHSPQAPAAIPRQAAATVLSEVLACYWQRQVRLNWPGILTAHMCPARIVGACPAQGVVLTHDNLLHQMQNLEMMGNSWQPRASCTACGYACCAFTDSPSPLCLTAQASEAPTGCPRHCASAVEHTHAGEPETSCASFPLGLRAGVKPGDKTVTYLPPWHVPPWLPCCCSAACHGDLLWEPANTQPLSNPPPAQALTAVLAAGTCMAARWSTTATPGRPRSTTPA